MSEVLTPDRVLDATEEVLRRFGPAKTTVVDVARSLGVSHGSVYRHFATKAALRDAVARRWLARVSEPLAAVVVSDEAAPDRLRRYVRTLSATKRRMAQDDPELFATFHQIVTDSPEVVEEHLGHLSGDLARIVADGVDRGELAGEPDRDGRAVLQATARFHHPAHVAEWGDPALDDDLEAVLDVVIRGLRP